MCTWAATALDTSDTDPSRAQLTARRSDSARALTLVEVVNLTSNLRFPRVATAPFRVASSTRRFCNAANPLKAALNSACSRKLKHCFY